MDTLSATLKAAQRSPARTPSLTLTLRDQRFQKPRLKWSRLYSGAEADSPVAAAIAPDGSLVRARNDAGTIYVSRVTTPEAGDAFGSWTSIEASATSGAGVALAATSSELVLLYWRNAGKDLTERISTDNGATWTAASTILTEASPCKELALAAKSNGDLCAFYAFATSTLRRLRRTSGTWAASSTAWTNSVTSILGVAAVHDGSDFQLVITGIDATDFNPVAWACIMGDGGFPANAWGSLVEIAEFDPGSSASYRDPALALLSGNPIALLTVNESGDVAHDRSYYTHPASTVVTSASWLQPYPVQPQSGDGAALAVAEPVAFAVESAVAQSADDALETSTGSVSIVTTEPISDDPDEWLGWRFDALDIPQGATIESAILTVTIRDALFDEPKHTFYGHAVDDAPAFAATDFDISSRPRTTASVLWDSADLGAVAGGTADAPDMSTILQELVDRAGWAPGNAVALFCHGDADGNRDLGVRHWDFASAATATLTVSYTPPAAPAARVWMVTPSGVWLAEVAEPVSLTPYLTEAAWSFAPGKTAARFVLDDSTGELAAPEAGQELELAAGYVGTAGSETGSARRFHIDRVERHFERRGTRRYVLSCSGPWEAAARWSSPSSQQFAVGARTRNQLFAFVAGRAGVPVLDGGNNDWNNHQPGFAMSPGESARTALARLAAPAEGVIRHEAGGFEIVDTPLTGTSGDDFGDGRHPVLAAVTVDEAPPVNWLRLQGPDRYADAFDAQSVDRYGPRFEVLRSLFADDDTKATAFAADGLEGRDWAPSLRLDVPYHATLRLFDEVTVTLDQLGLSVEGARVIGIENQYRKSPGKALYQSTLTLTAATVSEP